MPEDKYYKIFTIRFRKDEDAELIKELENPGVSKRELLHKWFYEKPEIPTDLCSIREVDKLLTTFRVPYLTRVNIINALKKSPSK